jgi:hypothetical protein
VFDVNSVVVEGMNSGRCQEAQPPGETRKLSQQGVHRHFELSASCLPFIQIHRAVEPLRGEMRDVACTLEYLLLLCP